MNSANYRVRRATTDDVGQLNSLWKSALLPAADLEKRFTEFQIVENPDGKILGAIGLQILGSEGKIHSEVYLDFAQTDQLRPILWDRLRSVANNHGLFRVWTDEPAPFWKKNCGFVKASAEVITQMPAPFSADKKQWLVLQLKEDRAAPSSLEAEFARLKADEQQRTQKMLEQARIAKGIAIGLVIILFIFVAVGVIYLLRVKSNLPR